MAIAEREKRSTMQYKDIGNYNLTFEVRLLICHEATVVRKADEFLFLEGAFSLRCILERGLISRRNYTMGTARCTDKTKGQAVEYPHGWANDAGPICSLKGGRS
jgi:hypothetical protein